MKDLRKTKSIRLLMEKFDQTTRAISVVELVKIFKQKMNRTTVYRVLDRLEENGFLHSFTGIGGLKWYAKYNISNNIMKVKDHPHFQCRLCGKSECLKIDLPIPVIPNYNIISTNIVLSGECHECISLLP